MHPHTSQSQATELPTVTCPYCAALVLEVAIACPTCKHALYISAPVLTPCPARPPARAHAVRWRPPVLLLVLLIAGASGIVVFLGSFAASPSEGRALEPLVFTAAGQYQITYTLRGTAQQVRLTYQNAGTTDEQAVVALPWATTVLARSGQVVIITAQNQSGTGSVTCAILRNGVPLTTTTAFGTGGAAVCRAIVV